MRALRAKYGPYALVTGASSDIGAESAAQLAADVPTLAPGPTRTEGAQNAPGIDFAGLPVPGMPPSPIVCAARRALGRRPLVLPGTINKASDLAGKYLTPRRGQTALFGTLVRRALDDKPRRG